MNVYIKWFLIVGFNSIFSFIFAFDLIKSIPSALGIISAIALFILFYVKLECFFLKTKRLEWRKALLIATLATGVFSLYPVIPMMSGALALDITGSLFHISTYGFEHKGFFSVFFTVLLTGLFLSLLVLILASILRVVFFKYPKLVKTGVDNG